MTPQSRKRALEKHAWESCEKSEVCDPTQTLEMWILYNTVIDFHGGPGAETYPEKPPK